MFQHFWGYCSPFQVDGMWHFFPLDLPCRHQILGLCACTLDPSASMHFALKAVEKGENVPPVNSSRYFPNSIGMIVGNYIFSDPCSTLRALTMFTWLMTSCGELDELPSLFSTLFSVTPRKTQEHPFVYPKEILNEPQRNTKETLTQNMKVYIAKHLWGGAHVLQVKQWI